MSESILFKMPHCWKSHVTAHMCSSTQYVHVYKLKWRARVRASVCVRVCVCFSFIFQVLNLFRHSTL